MNIGQASAASGVSAKMLRYYESIGLIPRANRTEAGYRRYTDAEVQTLRFIRRARDLGLSIERIRLLVGLWHDRERSSADVKRIAADHMAELEARIVELTAMRDTLQELAEACHGDHRPECPILRDLEGRRTEAQDRCRQAPAGFRQNSCRDSLLRSQGEGPCRPIHRNQEGLRAPEKPDRRGRSRLSRTPMEPRGDGGRA